jgi:hypothetical protein
MDNPVNSPDPKDGVRGNSEVLENFCYNIERLSSNIVTERAVISPV